jgi:hypothetical protein
MAAHEPVAAYSGSRVRRDLTHAELGDRVDRSGDEPKTQDRSYEDTTDVLGRGAANLFMAQYYAQEVAPSDRPAVAPESAAAAYPSLAFDDDILLPGEAIPLGWHSAPRLDIVV